jgi:hypothetical protein
VLPDEDQTERCDAEIDAAQPGGDRAEQQSGETGQQYREHERYDRRQTQPRLVAHADGSVLGGKERVAVGAHRDEEGVAERELAGLAEEQSQAERCDSPGEREHAEAKPEGIDVQRHCHGHDKSRHGRRDPRTRVPLADARHVDVAGRDGHPLRHRQLRAELETWIRHDAAPSFRTDRMGGPSGRGP